MKYTPKPYKNLQAKPQTPHKMNSSTKTKQIKTDHKDLIQDIAFDFYGKRVATASLVRNLNVLFFDFKHI